MKQIIETLKFGNRHGGFVVSIPDNPTNKAILDLHGLGERSWASETSSIDQVKAQVSNNLIAKTGLPFLIKNGFEIDFIVISPQMWGDGWWNTNFVKAVYDYCKEKYGFEYCFGHGISAGGKGIGQYVEKYPNDIIATVTNAGVRSHEPHKRINVPHWDLCNSGDKTTAAKLNAPPLINGLVAAGGIGYYTLFEGFGHHGGFWNNTLNGTIKGNQLTFENLDIKHKKEYVPSNFPIGDWFNSLISDEETETDPIPVEEEPEPEDETSVLPDTTSKNGLYYKIFESGKLFEIPEDLSGCVKIAEGICNNFDISITPIPHRFFMEFIGKIYIEKKGDYTFYLKSDDGSNLYINGEKIVDNNGLHSAKELSATISLEAGFNDIRVTYFNNWGGMLLELKYGIGSQKNAIEDNILFIEAVEEEEDETVTEPEPTEPEPVEPDEEEPTNPDEEDEVLYEINLKNISEKEKRILAEIFGERLTIV